MIATLNCDMGESFGLYTLGADEQLMPLISAANVACGFHGSDPNHMRQTVALAKAHGVMVGAHPSLPDLQGFGRREMAVSRDELANIVIYQIGALKGFLDVEGMELSHIKPHGALYAMAARDEDTARAICDAAEVFDVPIMGLPGTCHEAIYTERKQRFIAEFFADLEYDDDGHLIITRTHTSVDPERAGERARRAVIDGQAESANGQPLSVRASTICVHSDTPNAVDVARAVRTALSDS